MFIMHGPRDEAWKLYDSSHWNRGGTGCEHRDGQSKANNRGVASPEPQKQGLKNGKRQPSELPPSFPAIQALGVDTALLGGVGYAIDCEHIGCDAIVDSVVLGVDHDIVEAFG